MITFDRKAYDGFIFDCDGTLADTMPLHYQAWSETLELKLGRPSDFTESLFYRLGGMPARQIVERLMPHLREPSRTGLAGFSLGFL